MALQLSFDDAFGTTHPSAYHQISGLHLYPAQKLAKVALSVFVDSAARVAEKQPVGSKSYSIQDADYDTWLAPAVLDVVSQNPQERVYEYLKTLPEFSGATDV